MDCIDLCRKRVLPSWQRSLPSWLLYWAWEPGTGTRWHSQQVTFLEAFWVCAMGNRP